jgi:PhnB protein
MANLYPYIMSDDARKQAEFYVKALNGEIVFIKTFADMPQANEQTKDKVMHLRLRAVGQLFFISDLVREPVVRGNGMNLTLEFPDEAEARKAFEGLAEGGRVMMPFAQQFWGSMLGIVEDPFGVRWQIATGL